MDTDRRHFEASLPILQPRGLREGIRHIVKLFFGGDRRRLELSWGFLLLLLIAVVSILLVFGNREYSTLVTHTLEVQSRAYQLLTMVQNVENWQRSGSCWVAG